MFRFNHILPDFLQKLTTLALLVKVQALAVSLGLIALYIGAKDYLKKGFDFDKVLLVKCATLREIHFWHKCIFSSLQFADQFITAPLIGPVAMAYYNIVSV